MSIIASALRYERIAGANATLRLLRAGNLPVVAAVLETHLGVPGTKMVAEELFERVEGDLFELREHFELPKSAKAYCDDWRVAGFLIRRRMPRGARPRSLRSVTPLTPSSPKSSPGSSTFWIIAAPWNASLMC